MTKRDRAELRTYCRALADALELRDWTVTVHVGDVCDPNHPQGWVWGATSESTPGRKRVTLTFADDVRDWSLPDLRQAVAHELIHAHFSTLMELFRVDLLDHLERQAYELFNAGATRWLEYGVDAMADAVAPHLPLIDWRKPCPRGSRSAKSKSCA